jgi:GxxExxY protein
VATLFAYADCVKAELDALTQQVISAAIAVHREIGPSALESTYEACLGFELADRHLRIERQKPVPIVYRGRRLDCGYRMDLVVEEQVIVEVKAVRGFEPVHTAQLISYLIHSQLHVGLLLNFHVKWFVRGGIKRVVRDFPE